MARTRVWCGAAAAWVLLALAPNALGEPYLAVINAAGDAGARSAAAARVREVRVRLVAEGIARPIPDELAAVLEGAALLPSRRPRYMASLEPARRAYASFAYAEAQRLLEDEITSALARADRATLAPTLAELCFWRGKVAVAQADRAASARWFGCVLALAPTRSPDPATEPPQVQRWFARVRRQLGKRKAGSLRVDSTPVGAQVDVDGAALGAAPIVQASLAPGIHLLVVSHAGYERSAELVEVASTGGLERRIQLEALPAEERAAGALMAVVAEAGGADSRAVALAEIGLILGVSKLLVIEGRARAGLFARLVDLPSATLSEPAALGSGGLSPELAALVGVPPRPDPGPPPSAPSSAPAAAEPALDLTVPVPARRGSRPWYRRSYVWIGVAVTAAATAAAIWALGDDTARFECCSPPTP